MRKRNILALVFELVIACLIYFISSIYYIQQPGLAQPSIQAFLNKKYHHKFKIVQIEKHYSKDLFKQPVGYSLVLSDSDNLKFGNIYIQYNNYQKSWITYGGTDIERVYEALKK